MAVSSCACAIATTLIHVTVTLVHRSLNCVPLMNLYVRYRDLSRAITTRSSPPSSPEALDFGPFATFGGDALLVGSLVQVVTFRLQLWVLVIFAVSLLVMFDRVVPVMFSLKILWVVDSFIVVFFVVGFVDGELKDSLEAVVFVVGCPLVVGCLILLVVGVGVQ